MDPDLCPPGITTEDEPMETNMTVQNKPISLDGVEIKVGMKVAHFLDRDWSRAGEVFYIMPNRHGNFDVFFHGDLGHCNYWPDLICATPEGLRKVAIENLQKSIEYHESQVVEKRAELETLMKAG